MQVDWLIVGAGLTGCTLAERIASQLNQKVLLVERRDNIGGNAYDYFDEHGVLVHKFGPHIFHTNSQQVWGYLSEFTEWRPYYHRVLAVVDGNKVPVPFNLNSLYSLFPPTHAGRLERRLIQEYGLGTAVPILRLREHVDPNLRGLADYVYEKIFHGYTLKQWELTPAQLDPSVTGRVPIRVSRDDRYFQDSYQALPRLGYTAMFRRMLSHPNIMWLLNTDYRQIMGEVQYKRMVYTGSIDAFFEYAHGRLPYRSLSFMLAHQTTAPYQETGQINYPGEYAFTRITEFRHLTGQSTPGTTIAFEYPERYVEGVNDPYYPIPKADFQSQYEKYLHEARKLGERVLFAGRLADYRYYNMDQAVARALAVFAQQIAPASPAPSTV